MSRAPATRNVLVSGRRTSLRLESVEWEVLHSICSDEEMHLSQLCGIIDQVRAEMSLTAAVRIFIVSYQRAELGLESPTVPPSGLLAQFDPNAHRRSLHMVEALRIFE